MMVNLREYLITWSGSVNGLSVMYGLQSGGTIPTQRAVIGNLLDGMIALAGDNVTYDVAQAGKVLESSTGALTDTWTHASAETGSSGANTFGNVAQATQVYVRFATNVIRGNRNLAGGIYLPGLRRENMTLAGELSTTAQSSLQSAVNSFVGSGANLVVWGRPRAATPSDGVFGVISGGQVRRELSTQRGRRRA